MADDTLPTPPDPPLAVATPRVVSRRRGLPSGRAALGALLVCLAVLGTYLVQRRARNGPAASYVVAATTVVPGTALDRSDLELVAVDLPAELARHAYAEPSSLEGAVTLEPLEAGELIESGDVLRPRPGTEIDPPPHHDVTLSLEPDRVLDGDLSSGERVDVLATYGTDRTAETLLIAPSARVLAVDAGDGTLGAAGTVRVTLTVDDADAALRLAHAAEAAAVRLVRRTGTDAIATEGYRGPVAPAGTDVGDREGER